MKETYFRQGILILGICAIIYSAFLLLYLFDHINSFFFVASLMVLSLLPIILIVVYRRNRPLVNKLLIVMFAFLFLSLFELPLTQFEGHTYNAIGYREPELLLSESQIHLMAVSIKYIYFLEDEQEIRQNYWEEDLYHLIEIKNKDYYESKMHWLFSLLGLHKEEFQQMKENVLSYVGDDIDWINGFLQREDMEGNSAGLALALMAEVDRGNLSNDIPLAVTGTLEKDSSTKYVGSVPEKMLIAEKHGLRHFILPEENIKEAEEAKKKYQLKIRLHPVTSLEEAKEVIKDLNRKGAGTKLLRLTSKEQ